MKVIADTSLAGKLGVFLEFVIDSLPSEIKKVKRLFCMKCHNADYLFHTRANCMWRLSCFRSSTSASKATKSVGSSSNTGGCGALFTIAIANVLPEGT